MQLVPGLVLDPSPLALLLLEEAPLARVVEALVEATPPLLGPGAVLEQPLGDVDRREHDEGGREAGTHLKIPSLELGRLPRGFHL